MVYAAVLDPIDCVTDICHLAWLIRDNRHLLYVVGDATQCSNGTVFRDLRLNKGDCLSTTPSAEVIKSKINHLDSFSRY